MSQRLVEAGHADHLRPEEEGGGQPRQAQPLHLLPPPEREEDADEKERKTKDGSRMKGKVRNRHGGAPRLPQIVQFPPPALVVGRLLETQNTRPPGGHQKTVGRNENQ